MRKSGDMASADAICPRILPPHSMLETPLPVLSQNGLVPGTATGYRWPGTQRIGPPGNGNRESAPLR